MPADAQIRFKATSSEARREINQLKREVQELRQQLGQTQRAATESTVAVDRLGDEAREAAIGVTSLGRNIFKTSAEAKRFSGVFTDAQGRIREANGEFAKTRETIDRLGDEARESARDVDLLGDKLARTSRGHTDFTRSTEGASRGSQIFTRALGGVGRVLGELGLTSAVHLIGQFATSSVRAAGEMEQYVRATEQITGSARAAAERLAALEEVANLPGLNFEALTRYSNRLIAAGVSAADTDKILLSVGQTVVSLGGTAEKAGLAMEQLIQAIQLGTVDMRDFRTIVQQIPGFLEALGDVHGVAANLDGLHEAFNNVGRNMRDLLIPTFDELARRYESPPPESYIVSVDRLQNSWFLLRAELGEKVLPAISATARGLSGLFDEIRDFLDGGGIATQTATEFAEGLEKINSAASRRQALEDRVNSLRQLELALTAERAGLSQSSDEYLNLSKQIQAAQTEQDRWNSVLERSPAAAASLESEIAKLNARFQVLNERLNQPSGTRTAESLAQTQRQFDEVSTSLSVLNQLLSDVQSGFTETADTVDTTTRGIVGSVDEFGGVFSEIDTRFLTFHERAAALTGVIRELPPRITAVRSELDVLAPTAERVAAIFGSLNTSLVDNQRELDALTAVTQNIIQELQDLEGLAHVRAVIAERTDVQNVNLVNRAITEAAMSMRDYIGVMDDMQDRFESTEGISDRLTTSIRNQASAFDTLRSSVAGVSAEVSGLQGQQLGADIFDQFDARTPGRNFGASFRDNIGPIAAQLGQELASQAIRTAGTLRQIERDRVESLADLEREYSERIVEINERKAERLADVERQIEDERIRRLASIEEAFEDAAIAEVEARQTAADRIQQIEARAAEQRQRLRERLNDRLLELEQRRDERIQDLNDGFIEREQERQQRILEITENAAEARADAEQRYADRVQEINNRLFESVSEIHRRLQEEIESLESGFVARQSDRADEIVRITQEAADARAAANQSYVDTMQGIYNDLVAAWDDLEEGFTERQADRAAERIEIEERAAQDRIDAYAAYNQRVARISTDLVDEIRDIQDEITEVIEDAQTQRIAIEQDAIDARAEANAAYTRQLSEIETERERVLEDSNRRLAAIQQAAADDRLAADRDYAERFQDIQNDLVERVVDIQRDLNDTLNGLRDEQLDAEQDRLDSLVDLHEDTQQRIEDLARSGTETREDIERRFQQDVEDARREAFQDLGPDATPEEIEQAQKELTRRLFDLGRERNRRLEELGIQEARRRAEIARRAAAQEQQIAEQAAARQAEIAQQQADARSQAQAGITAAESAAGVTFQEAQANYVPALSAHEQALSEHTAALNRINAEAATATEAVEQSRTEALQTGIDAAAVAAQTLSEALSAVTAAEQERLSTLQTETAGTLSGLNQQITDAETRTGLSFQEALENYTPAVDLNTQALQALTEALNATETERVSAVGAVDAAGALDRRTTQTAQQALETGAGVSIEEARANFVPALSSAAQATLTLNATMRELDGSFREAIAEIQNAGLVDRQATDAAIQEAVANAISQQTALETQAGTTFADASLAFQPGISDIAQAGVDRDTALSDIDQSETADIDALGAQSIADRLETDAAITEARDNYIKARDTELFKHNVAILQLNQAEAADIKGVRATLSKNLVSIDEKLDLELAEIREAKIVFDTRIGELIDAINAEANQDVSALKADTAAMRSSLEEIAAEARDSAWKEALLKITSTGITIAGVAAGTALGNPVAGLAIGQAAGNLVEQAGNELFHFHQTDAIANRLARQAAFRRSRPAPDYLPTPTQLRNAEDLGREVISGFLDGVNQRSRRDSGLEDASQQASFPEEINATVVLQWPDGATIDLRDQMIRLQNQDRSL